MNNTNNTNNTNIFTLFLKIGCFSFGGFMALIAIVQKEVVEKRKLLPAEEVIDGVSLAGLLPGPMAVNVVTYIGYLLDGWRGALKSFLGILLPAFVFMVFIAHLYFLNNSIINVKVFTSYFLPIVCSIIITAGIDLCKKNVSDKYLFLIILISTLLNVFTHSYWITLLSIVISGYVGYKLYLNTSDNNNNTPTIKLILKKTFKDAGINIAKSILFFLLLLLTFILLENITLGQDALYWSKIRQIYTHFCSISLTLLGGGYVFIPIMQNMVVNELNWIDLKAFSDSIAFGQLTPGPIMISATFIGYKVAGLGGALIATFSMFAPPALLMIFLSKVLPIIKSSSEIKAAFKGIRAMVVGLIFSAAITLAASFINDYTCIIIFFCSILVQLVFKTNIMYLIPLSGVLSYFLSKV